MTDTAPTDAPETPAPEPEDTRTGDDSNAEVERLRNELTKARKWEERAKANAKAAQELEQLKAASMSDMEKAVNEAKQEGRMAAIAEVGTKVAAAEFRAAAAGRLTAEQTEALIGRLNLASFLDDSGEVDREAIGAYVAEIAPEKKPAFPDLGQGARTTNPKPLDPRAADLAQIEADLRSARTRV